MVTNSGEKLLRCACLFEFILFGEVVIQFHSLHFFIAIIIEKGLLFHLQLGHFLVHFSFLPHNTFSFLPHNTERCG